MLRSEVQRAVLLEGEVGKRKLACGVLGVRWGGARRGGGLAFSRLVGPRPSSLGDFHLNSRRGRRRSSFQRAFALSR
jgi:hypothetical protein